MRLDKVFSIFKIKEIRKKVFFVFVMMVIFRLAANIPIPGIDRSKLSEFFQANQFFGLMNVFTGGAMERLSLVMIGLGPYITAIIIMQLLSLVFPKLEQMYKEEGEAGRKKFNQYARIATVPFAIVQGFSMLKILESQGVLGEISNITLVAAIFSITAGSVFLMWIGELITEKGIGNGISLLIFAGIIADVPNSIRQSLYNWDPSQITQYLIFGALSVIIIIGVIIVNEARRNVPVSYAKRVRGNKMYGGVSTYLPMMINPAGVIPIIFAMSIMMLPGILAGLFTGSSIRYISRGVELVNNLFTNAWLYGLFYFLLVVLFTFFYTAVTFDPKNIAENLQKMGGFVPGLRPGKQTSDFLSRILNRVLLLGAVFLGLIAVAPTIVQGLTGITSFSFAIGGTALLILVSVVLETSKQIESQLEMREYD